NPTGPGILDYNNINSVRAKWFNALDIRITKKWYFKRWSFELFVDVQNVYAALAPSPPSFVPVYSADGVTPLVDPNDPSRFQYSLVNTGSRTVLPTIGFVIYY
nr:hypothetical protein [Chitinophagales bacterium]